MLYQINKGTKYFGANDVFEDIQFEINGTEKIAVVGRNGCGKSTLLKIMMNEETLSSGSVHAPNNLSIGYLAQTTFTDDNLTVKEEMEKVFAPILLVKEKLDNLAEELNNNYSEDLLKKYSDAQNEFELMNGYNYHQELETVFTKFGFKVEDLNRTINTFSGGQKTRIAFVKLLLSKPDILLLDEPTNHLDLKTIEWLEGYLKRYPRAIVLVSHDRVFLDEIAEVVYEIEYGKMKKYIGNYSKFVELKKQDQEKQASAYTRQQKEIERLEDLIEKFRYKKNKAAFAQSKIKYLDRMEVIDQVDKSDTKTFKAHFEPRVKGGKTVLTMENLTVGYDVPLCTVNLEIRNNDKICILGDNGTGKSTLVKTIMGLIPKLGGDFLFGHQIEVGYFDQQLAQINSNKTVLEELWDDYPDLDRTSIRKVLGQFLFSADDVFKTVNVLSGGEKVRLFLAKLMLKQPNFLILDEPTNHLDIIGKEALEESLNGYKGTILFVSHDRYFIKKLAKSCLVLENNNATYYQYGYKEYVDASNEINSKPIANIIEQEKPRLKQSSINTQIRKLESKIDELEKLIEEKRELRFDPSYYHDYKKMDELNEEIDDINNQIENAMNKWEELQQM